MADSKFVENAQWLMGGGKTVVLHGRPCAVRSASNRKEAQTVPLVEEQNGRATVGESAEGGEWCLVATSRSLVFGCRTGEL